MYSNLRQRDLEFVQRDLEFVQRDLALQQTWPRSEMLLGHVGKKGSGTVPERPPAPKSCQKSVGNRCLDTKIVSFMVP